MRSRRVKVNSVRMEFVRKFLFNHVHSLLNSWGLGIALGSLIGLGLVSFGRLYG